MIVVCEWVCSGKRVLPVGGLVRETDEEISRGPCFFVLSFVVFIMVI